MQVSFDNTGPKLSIKKILAHVDEEAIYERFAAGYYPKRSCHSPFRKDPTPSFGFFEKRGKIQWKDNATGQGGDCFDFVCLAENTDMEGALQIIASAFNIDFEPTGIIRYAGRIQSVIKYEHAGKSHIWAVRREPSLSDLAYWNQVLVSQPIFDFLDIRVADEIYVKRGNQSEGTCVWRYKPDNPIFYWLSADGKRIKAYRPMEADKRWKWLSNMDDATDIMGYRQANIKQCPGRPLILTKSLKEIGWYKAFGLTAMAQNAEGYIMNADFIRHIKKYCFPILSIYDADMAGVKGMQRLKKEHGIAGMVIPKYGPKRLAKDPTDLWTTDYRQAYNLLNLIDEYLRHLRRRPGMDTSSFGFRST